MMQLRLFALACFTSVAVQAANPLMKLGTPSLALLQYSTETIIEENAAGECSYTLSTKFNHEDSFPMGGPETCVPGVKADDGGYFLGSRWYYERFDYATRLATGFDHISIDWNACGHPGFGFQTPHYDAHVYTVSPEFRATQMQCNTNTGTPVCKPEAEQDGTGRGYYVFGEVASTRQLDNLPADYTWDMHSAVEFMGTHAGNVNDEPTHPDLWEEPKLYFCNFNGHIDAVEPMLPYDYVSGKEYKFHEEVVDYEVLTLVNLPTYYSIEYDPRTEFTTMVFKGKSAICEDVFLEAKLNGEPGSAVADTTTTSAAFHVGLLQTSALAALGLVVALLI